jgi:hypothetical protein
MIRPGWHWRVDDRGVRRWSKVVGDHPRGVRWVLMAATVPPDYLTWEWSEIETRGFAACFRRGNPPREVKAALYRSPLWGDYRRSLWEVARERRRLEQAS